jgi:HAD superfamily hydrolase (TIGR01549 family)
MNMPIRAVIFDVGETLIDETRLYDGWAEAMGVSPVDFMRTLEDIIAEGSSYRNVFERLKPGFDVKAAAKHRRESGKDFKIEARDLYADARDCLATLTQQGLYVGIAGNQPLSAAATLTSFELGARMIVTSAELGVDKPAPEFFKLTLERAGVATHETLYVGDRVDNDVIPGHAFGLRTALLERGPWGRNHGRLPEAALATFRIKALAELPPLVAAANARTSKAR